MKNEGTFPGDNVVTGNDLIANARQYEGQQETDRQLRDKIKASGRIDPVTTPWCAAFVNMNLADLDLQGTASNLAKSFLNIGVPVDEPKVGVVAVFNRTANPTFGHVGVITSVNKDGTISV